MTEKAFCSSCGHQIPLDARFCNNCGAEQEALPAAAEPAATPPVAPPVEPAPEPPRPAEPTTPPPPPPPPPDTGAGTPPPSSGQARDFARQATQRVEQATPGAQDFGRELAAQFATPGVAAAGIAALATLALMLAVGLVLAILPAENSLFRLEGGSFIDRTLVHAATFTSAPLKYAGGGAIQTMPMIFVLLPLGGMAVAIAAQRSRLAQVPALPRLGFAAAGALPLALLLLIVAIAGEIDGEGGSVGPDVAAVFFLALLWGAIGGLIGAALTLRGEQSPAAAGSRIPPVAQRGLRAAFAALRSLLLGLALTAVVGSLIVAVQTVRDAGDVKGERSTLVATIENALYLPEHGLHVFELGSFVKFETSFPTGSGLPIPIEKVDKLVGNGGDDDADDEALSFRLFDYSGAVPSWLFILGVLGFVTLPLLLALYAGWAAARVAGATTPQIGAAWGALTGPVWAIVLVILNGVANKTETFSLWGLANGGSVFGWSLLIGTGLGALGGVLSTRGKTAQPAAPAPGAATGPAPGAAAPSAQAPR